MQIQLKCRLYLVLKTPEHLEHPWPSLFRSRPLVVESAAAPDGKIVLIG